MECQLAAFQNAGTRESPTIHRIFCSRFLFSCLSTAWDPLKVARMPNYMLFLYGLLKCFVFRRQFVHVYSWFCALINLGMSYLQWSSLCETLNPCEQKQWNCAQKWMICKASRNWSVVGTNLTDISCDRISLIVVHNIVNLFSISLSPRWTGYSLVTLICKLPLFI